MIVNSLSGGKTSSYMAAHYPADYNVFALVCIEAEYCRLKDKAMERFVSDKIGKDFIATAESDKTLYVMRDLEQMLGQEIKWVAGETFEQVIKKKKAIPNKAWRFCTTEMKIKPIFEFCREEVSKVVWMNIGFRYDEQERGERNKRNTHFKAVVGKSPKGRNKWKEIGWRIPVFPMIEDKVFHHHVREWANSTGLIFPHDSNCAGCFWKDPMQLRKNWDDEPQKMRWFSEMEQRMKRTWKDGYKYETIRNIGLQSDFFFGTGSGCQAGFCTD